MLGSLPGGPSPIANFTTFGGLLRHEILKHDPEGHFRRYEELSAHAERLTPPSPAPSSSHPAPAPQMAAEPAASPAGRGQPLPPAAAAPPPGGGERRRCLSSSSQPPPCLLRADTDTDTARAASRGPPRARGSDVSPR